MSVCPDCTAGEHHPTHEVTTIGWISDVPVTETCTCPCAEQIIGPTMLVPGERGYIFTGRYVDRILSIDAIQGGMYVGTVLNHLSEPYVVHVPTSWVRRMDK